MLIDKKVLIVGAGPAGLTAALLMARAGIVPRVIDQQEGPSRLSRAVGIFPKTLNILPPAVADQIVENSVVMERAKIYRNDKIILEFTFPEGQYMRPCGYPQNKTEELLRTDFEQHGGRVEYNLKLQSLNQQKQKVQVVIDDRQFEFDYVIGADGAASVVRQEIGQQHRGFTLSEKWSIADFHTDDLDHCFNLWLLDSGVFVGYVPIGSDRYRLFARSEDALATLLRKINISQLNRQGVFSVAVRKADKFSVGNVYLVGDAAHVHTPLGGRGMNLAMQDSAELVERFVSGRLSGYSDARRKQAIATANFSERMRFVFSSENGLLLFFRDTLFKLVNNVSFLKKRFAKNFVEM